MKNTSLTPLFSQTGKIIVGQTLSRFQIIIKIQKGRCRRQATSPLLFEKK